LSRGYLTEEEGAFLLRLARQTITEALDPAATAPGPVPTERLLAPGAAFVTLHTRGGELRGCIGSLIGYRPLVEDVRTNALAAAFEDPRFPALQISELPEIVIEVSVLTEPEPLEYDSAEELVRKLRPGIDGVIIERGWHRATFLPQVWDQLPLTEDFLAHLCYKAGLSGMAWRDGDLQISTYQAQEFEEGT
jgi:AmmeMemoRadiSam system protein A